MRLLHYSKEPFTFDAARKYESPHWKPSGLWVSVEGEDDWQAWCEGEGWGVDGLAHATEITLEPDANILLIDSEEKLVEFDRHYGNGDPHDLRSIRWGEVKATYDGVIVAPYQWGLRLDLMWYYGWDCASGVIWNLDAIAFTKPTEARARVVERGERQHMRFNCGQSAAARWAATYEWNRWFAWHPIRVGPRECRWLEVMERRRVSGAPYCGPSWEHRIVLSHPKGASRG